MTMTSKDMEDQVTDSLRAGEQPLSDFNITAIVDELQERYGTVHIDEIPSDAYWAIIQKHDATQQDA